ncbi:hypothetical protein ANN_10611 [Periplaneta americana]|uniref:Uncharacterized protein n=1 Tax=Periplaneta americana TaxID=6978 RepID=A0ABQ8TSA9_PERAM|nr:hypothetical protein ANN_10611 [Periplaneta americana]
MTTVTLKQKSCSLPLSEMHTTQMAHLICISCRAAASAGFERSDDVIQKPLHIAWVKIWCAVSGHEILGPYFVEDGAQNPKTVTQVLYRDLIITSFVRDLRLFCLARNLPVELQWMQQDGATVQSLLLQRHLRDCLISRGSPFPYPSCSPDLTGPRCLHMGHDAGDLRKIFGAKRDEVTGEWRKLHNAELHALHPSPDIIRNIKSRRLRWAGHVARMGESRNAYRVLVGRPEGKRPLERPRRRWEDNIKMDLREVGYDGRG